jgi:hypothetical protein
METHAGDKDRHKKKEKGRDTERKRQEIGRDTRTGEIMKDIDRQSGKKLKYTDICKDLRVRKTQREKIVVRERNRPTKKRTRQSHKTGRDKVSESKKYAGC